MCIFLSSTEECDQVVKDSKKASPVMSGNLFRAVIRAALLPSKLCWKSIPKDGVDFS